MQVKIDPNVDMFPAERTRVLSCRRYPLVFSESQLSAMIDAVLDFKEDAHADPDEREALLSCEVCDILVERLETAQQNTIEMKPLGWKVLQAILEQPGASREAPDLCGALDLIHEDIQPTIDLIQSGATVRLDVDIEQGIALRQVIKTTLDLCHLGAIFEGIPDGGSVEVPARDLDDVLAATRQCSIHSAKTGQPRLAEAAVSLSQLIAQTVARRLATHNRGVGR